MQPAHRSIDLGARRNPLNRGLDNALQQVLCDAEARLLRSAVLDLVRYRVVGVNLVRCGLPQLLSASLRRLAAAASPFG